MALAQTTARLVNSRLAFMSEMVTTLFFSVKHLKRRPVNRHVGPAEIHDLLLR